MEQKLLLEKELEPIFLGKFPEFPEEVKEFLVKYGPYLMLVAAIIGLLGLLTAFGVGTAAIALLPYGASTVFWLAIILSAIVLIIYLIAFSPLRARKIEGWRLLYYALLLNLLGSLIQLNILSLLVGGAIGFWVLFQIRSKYA